ncbi:hypothetical protein ACFE04_017729 [Oxalis oulophora]
MVLFQINSNNAAVAVYEDDTETPRFSEDFDSTCSTPYVSAPSSPGRGLPPSHHGYFFSAPASPMHFVLSSSATCSHVDTTSSTTQTDDFEFSSRFSSNGTTAVGLVRSADELFLNGQIRPIKLASHLQKPQILAPLIDLEDDEDNVDDEGEGDAVNGNRRGRDKLKLRSRSVHRKARSLSPLRNAEFQWRDNKEDNDKIITIEPENEIEPVSTETTPSGSASTSRSSSTSGRNSKKWISFKDLLYYRSKSEGRANSKDKFWSNISFSPTKEKKISESLQKPKQKQTERKKSGLGRPENGVAAKRRGSSGHGPSPHELHYTVNRAQAEEMKKRTYLPYRQGLFGCLGFSSKGYSAFNGFTKSLNPVSSR